MQKTVLILIAIVLLHSISAAQSTNNSRIIYSGSIIISHYLGVEAGVLFAAPSGSCSDGILRAPKLSAEAYLTPRSFILAPKIGYEIDLINLGFRASIADYTDFSKHDFRVTPEVGLTAGGKADIFYGYNIAVTTNKLPETPSHRLTISFNIDHSQLFPPHRN